jgi:DNA-binding NtrC family response regulator
MLPDSKTVLLVDDSFIDLHLYSRPLSEAGYRPITSLIGTHFGGIHINEKPSLILLDYRLKSNISALDLVKILRDLFSDSLIVLFSVLPDLPAEMKGVVDGFLHKGDPARLAEEVQNLLDERLTRSTKN